MTNPYHDVTQAGVEKTPAFTLFKPWLTTLKRLDVFLFC